MQNDASDTITITREQYERIKNTFRALHMQRFPVAHGEVSTKTSIVETRRSPRLSQPVNIEMVTSIKPRARSIQERVSADIEAAGCRQFLDEKKAELASTLRELARIKREIAQMDADIRSVVSLWKDPRHHEFLNALRYDRQWERQAIVAEYGPSTSASNHGLFRLNSTDPALFKGIPPETTLVIVPRQPARPIACDTNRIGSCSICKAGTHGYLFDFLDHISTRTISVVVEKSIDTRDWFYGSEYLVEKLEGLHFGVSEWMTLPETNKRFCARKVAKFRAHDGPVSSVDEEQAYKDFLQGKAQIPCYGLRFQSFSDEVYAASLGNGELLFHQRTVTTHKRARLNHASVYLDTYKA